MLTLVVALSAQAQGADLEERIRELERQVELLQEQLAEQDSALVARLMRQIEAITREIEELKLGQEVAVSADEGAFGLGPAASKVYRVDGGVSIGGYGEILYENFSGEREDGLPSGKTDQLDVLRAVVYVGYKFDDQFLFNSEIELEHAGTGGSGSVSVEFAYLDYLASQNLGIRGGLVLLPMGLINELHEPPTFLGSERPETERQIIPGTWREVGLGVFGEAAGLAYRAYVVNGLDAVGDGSSGADGFSSGGLRGGRQKGSRAVAEDFAGVARLDYVRQLGVIIGASGYVGESGQNNLVDPEDPASETVGALTVILEGHAEYRAHGLDLRGLIAWASVDDAELINEAKGFTSDESVGEELFGWYVQAGYDVLHRTRTRHQLIPYVRFEQLDTQQEVPAGFSSNPANDRQIISLGAAWKPLTNIIVKADYQIHSNEADTGVDQVSAVIGYLF